MTQSRNRRGTHEELATLNAEAPKLAAAPAATIRKGVEELGI